LKENKLIDGSSGVSSIGPSNKVKSALRKAIKKINKSSCESCGLLKKLFESKYGLPPENILFANSLKELIYLIPEALKPIRVLIVGPALDMYEDASRSAGAEVSYINTLEKHGFAFDIPRIHEALNNIDLVFFANPNRIAGKMISWEKIREVITLTQSGGPHFVIDESLIEFTGCDDYHSDMMQTSNLTILRTTAFFYGMPGLELAYAVSSPEIIHLYEKKKHWDINLLSVEAARTAYKDSTYRKASKKYMLFEMKTIIRLLNKIEWITVYDTDINIVLIKIDKNPDDVAWQLRRAGIDIRACSKIEGLDRSFFTIAVMKHENNLKLISTLNSINQNSQF